MEDRSPGRRRNRSRASIVFVGVLSFFCNHNMTNTVTAWVSPASRKPTAVRPITGFAVSTTAKMATNTALLSNSASVDTNDVDILQQQGTERIHMAMRTCGWDPASITIQWQKKAVVVTVVGDGTYVSAPEGMDDGVEAGLLDDDDDDADLFLEDVAAGGEVDDSQESDLNVPSSTASAATGIDLAVLARAINVAMEGLEPIASSYRVEVTTPGIQNNRLVGDVMFQAYRGFDVTAIYAPPDKKKPQRIEGKLVERNENQTIINVKGRMRKLPNEHVVEVYLPPAKKEKK